MSNKWETAKIKKEEFAEEWHKYLNGTYKSKYPIAEKYKVDYTTVGRIAKRFDLPKKRVVTQIDMDVFIEVYNRCASGEIKQEQAAKELGISLPTFQKWIYKLFENNLKVEGLPFLFDEQTEWQQ